MIPFRQVKQIKLISGPCLKSFLHDEYIKHQSSSQQVNSEVLFFLLPFFDPILNSKRILQMDEPFQSRNLS